MMTRIAVVWALTMSVALPALAEESGEAREHFDRARRLEAAGDLSEALTEYERANELRPAHRLHRHMGRVCQGLGRHSDAIEHYEQFLSEGGRRVPVTRRRDVEAALAEAREHVGSLTIEAPEGATVSIDGIPVGRAPFEGAIMVNEGQRSFEASLEGHHAYSEELTVVGGAERTVAVTMEPVVAASEETVEPRVEPELEPAPVAGAEESLGAHRAWFWTGLALSVATLAGGAALGGLALTEASAFEELNVPDRSDADELQLDEIESRGGAMSLGADVLLFTGAALAVATFVLAFFTDFGGEEPPVEASLIPSPSGAFFTLSLPRGF